MRYANSVVAKRFSRNSLIVLLGVLLSSIITPIVISPLLSAQTAEIRATVEDPTVAISVISIEYQSINGQSVARITARTRFSETVRAYMSGVLVATQSVAYGSVWTELTFDILLPDDQAYEIILQASNSSATTVAETIVQAQYPVDPNNPETPPEESDTGSNLWWPLPPNTGELFIPSPQNVAIWMSCVTAAGIILCALWHRRKHNENTTGQR